MCGITEILNKPAFLDEAQPDPPRPAENDIPSPGRRAENPHEICMVQLKSLIKPTKKHDRNHTSRPDENDTPSSNLLVVVLLLLLVVVLLASREWKAGSAGNKRKCESESGPTR